MLSRFFNRRQWTLQEEVARAVARLPKSGGFEPERRGRLEAADWQSIRQVATFLAIEEMGPLCPVNSMYHFAPTIETQGTRPIWLAKLDFEGQEMFLATKAVQACRMVFGAELVMSGRHPLLREVLLVEDDPANPFLIEGLGDITNFDLHAYVVALGQARAQDFLLCRSDNSVACSVTLRVDEQFRDIYYRAFLDVARAYGTPERSSTEHVAAVSRYQMTHRQISLPPRTVRLTLA